MIPMNSQIDFRRVDVAAPSPEDKASVETVLMNSPGASAFHSLEWNQILTNEFELENVTILATQDQRPVGLFSYYVDGIACRSPLTRLETYYGGPISTSDPRVERALLREAENTHRFAWFDIWGSPGSTRVPLLDAGYSGEEFHTPILNLQRPEQDLWRGIGKKRRNLIRKAERSGVRIVVGDASLIDAYHPLVVSTFQRKQVPIYPKSFYRRIVEQLGARGKARFLLAEHAGKFIAGAIFLVLNDTVYFWHGASDKDSPSIAQNDLIHWRLIQWARQEGYRYYDFMVVQPDRLPGLAHFKMSFGGEIVPFHNMHKATLGYWVRRAASYAARPRALVHRLRQPILGTHG